MLTKRQKDLLNFMLSDEDVSKWIAENNLARAFNYIREWDEDYRNYYAIELMKDFNKIISEAKIKLKQITHPVIFYYVINGRVSNGDKLCLDDYYGFEMLDCSYNTTGQVILFTTEAEAIKFKDNNLGFKNYIVKNDVFNKCILLPETETGGFTVIHDII